MHYDKLKKCDARKLPRWFVDYMRSQQGKSPRNLNDHSGNEVSAGGSSITCNASTKDPADIATGEKLFWKQPDRPFRDTSSHFKGKQRHDETIVGKLPKRGNKRIQKSYCVCNKANSKRLMVQCDFCRDRLHPECVVITAEIAERIDVPLYTSNVL